MDNLSFVEQIPPFGMQPPYRAMQCLEDIMNEGDRPAVVDSIKTVCKIVDAVIATPNDPAKRRLRLTNPAIQRKIAAFPSAIRLLQSAGFVERDHPELGAVLQLEKAYIGRLAETVGHIRRHLQSVGEEAPAPPVGSFNPYVSQIRSMNPDQRGFNTEDQTKFDPFAAQRAIDARAAFLLAGGETQQTPFPLEPLISVVGFGQGIEEALRLSAIAELEATEGDVMKVLGADGIQALKSSLSGSNAKFQSRRHQELDRLYKQKVFKKAVIRMQLPDQTCLQLDFRPSSKIQDVLNGLLTFVTPQAQELKSSLFLFTAPPFRRYTPQENLFEADLIPGAIVHVGADGKHDELLKQLLKDGNFFLPELTQQANNIRNELQLRETKAADEKRKAKEELQAAIKAKYQEAKEAAADRKSSQ